jgi:hypothetical protein
MAKAGDLSPLLVHIFHYFWHNYQRVYLGVLRVYFYEDEALF